jgi:formyltetrahydrofolate synthetase
MPSKITSFLQPVPSDITVSQSIVTQPINEVAEDVGVLPGEYDLYGKNKSKISLAIRDRMKNRYITCTRCI